MTDQNVVIVLMDTARFSAVKDVRKRTQTTLDALTEDGYEYSNTFTNAPWSLPSHASLFTGTYTSRHGTHADFTRLTNELRTLPEIFQQNGYQTVGISNNTWISEEFGFGRGFETFRKTWQYVQSDIDLGRIARTKEGTDQIKSLATKIFDGNPIINTINAIYGQFFRRQYDDGARQTNIWIDDWLTERQKSDPFFLFINYLEPHLEYRPPKEFAAPYLPSDVSYKEATQVSQDAFGYIAGSVEMTEYDFEVLQGLYRGEIAYLDHQIGELKKSLVNHDEWENTIFVVTGDHGENIGDHGLMDHQYCLYDTLLHVPLILHGGPFMGGEDIDDIVQLTDLAPTLLDSAGIDAPEFRKQTQGRSFHPDADSEPRKYAFAEYLTPQPSMHALEKRVGELPDHVRKYDRSLRAVRTNQYKYIQGSDGLQELYDIQNDPGETDDIADSHETLVTQLDEKLDAWIASFESADHNGDVSMDADTKARLEDLGYLQ